MFSGTPSSKLLAIQYQNKKAQSTQKQDMNRTELEEGEDDIITICFQRAQAVKWYNDTGKL